MNRDTVDLPPATALGRAHHDEEGHRRDANRAIGISAIGLALTGGIELALAVVTGSVALLGDALHNLSDVSTSAVVFLGFHISKRKPSPRYPYGYERAEDLAGLGVALVIWGSAVFAGVESYLKLVGNGGTTHVGMAWREHCLASSAIRWWLATNWLWVSASSQPLWWLTLATRGLTHSRRSVLFSGSHWWHLASAGATRLPASR
jgi:divalent metal cation (Fe/Co/Zn/Cd) transporter